MFGTMIRRLEVFCAVIEAGGATRAAAQMGLSQPAVSQQIARLEKELGVVLFVRSHGRMRPTETALAFYDETRQAFDGVERVLSIARDYRRLDRGLLRVAAPHSAAPRLVPVALRRLMAEHPRLRLSVRLGSYAQINAMVSAREVDLGLSKLPTPAGVETCEVLSTELCAVLAEGAVLPGAGPVDPAGLATQPLVMIGRGRPWRDEIDAAFRRLGIAPRVAVETQSVASAVGFAAAGFGTAIVPHWLALGLVGASRVRPLDLPIRHSFVVVHPVRTPLAELAADFASALRAALGTGAQRVGERAGG